MYASPEAMKGEHTKTSDVFSFGAILSEMLTRNRPYEGLMCGQIMLGVSLQGLRPHLPDAEWPELCALARRCMEQDPDARSSFLELEEALMDLEDRLRPAPERQRSLTAVAAPPQQPPPRRRPYPGGRPYRPLHRRRPTARSLQQQQQQQQQQARAGVGEVVEVGTGPGPTDSAPPDPAAVSLIPQGGSEDRFSLSLSGGGSEGGPGEQALAGASPWLTTSFAAEALMAPPAAPTAQQQTGSGPQLQGTEVE
ncbi:hypothetical protein HYH03_004319 [Edaphochlamys debaryana]|uniref:Protein kinase domain-containing protein n=1 Tax=Edaphochlamys debaryana TaxID=47281 RepID=A0A835YA63_9CHLO|nr:hypothetical protein HYH03_004319 [Edaphochlamys debaryana]|eukprot:KAG2497573.1 hypothetical protein HYH03_004319 [Edaphochlamys debaryana]